MRRFRHRHLRQPFVAGRGMLRLSRSTQAVVLLGLTQIIGYGTLYYPFAILADGVAAEFAISKSVYFGIFSAALVAGGLVMSTAGRAFDRIGAAVLMGPGSMACGAALVVMAFAPNTTVFALAMVAAQLASGLVLYDAAFTALVQFHAADGGRRIMHLTLIAGFASSIFWPVTQWIDAGLGWRATLLVFAGLNLLVCAPLHVWLARHLGGAETAGGPEAAEIKPARHEPVPLHRAGTIMALITAGFALSSIALAAVISQMVPLLQNLGFGAASLAVSTLFGPAQVVVRFTNLLFGASTHPLRVTIFAMALLPLAFVTAGLAAPSLAAAIAFAVLVGMASGLKSIVQGTLPLALFGSKGYGARLGFMSTFRYVFGALAPFAFAFASEATSTIRASFIFAGIGALGVACFLAVTLLLPAPASSTPQPGP